MARADACRTARHGLALIATARPLAFIVTMAKEVARYNAMAQNAQAQSHYQQQLHNSVLVRGRPEILRVIDLLVKNIPNDVADQLVEVFYLSMLFVRRRTQFTTVGILIVSLEISCVSTICKCTVYQLVGTDRVHFRTTSRCDFKLLASIASDQ